MSNDEFTQWLIKLALLVWTIVCLGEFIVAMKLTK